MITIHVDHATTFTSEQYVACPTDYGPGREQVSDHRGRVRVAALEERAAATR